MEEEVLYTVDKNNIAWLTLNRPDVHNAFNAVMIQKITDHLKKLQETPDVRVLVIQGKGESFCAGADLSWMKGSAQMTTDENFEDARTHSMMLQLLDNLPIPTLTYAQGANMGGGVGIIACSDIVLSDPNAFFSFPEIKMGLVPSVIAPYVLRAMNARFARRYFLTGEKFDATLAQHMGLIHEVVDLEKRDAEIDKFVSLILSGGPNAVGQAKKLIRQIMGVVSEETRLKTIELIANIRISEEGRQGVTAFLEKTTPHWTPSVKPDD